MELVLLAIGIALLGILLGWNIGYGRGFRFGQKDEQIFFGVVIARLSTRENLPDLIDKVAREYNLTMMEIIQKIQGKDEGR